MQHLCNFQRSGILASTGPRSSSTLDSSLKNDTCISSASGPKCTAEKSDLASRPAVTVTSINSEIDAFLSEAATAGYVLDARESTIGQRLARLEGYEHVLPPIEEARGGYAVRSGALTLTYSLPKANLATKPLPEMSALHTAKRIPDAPAKDKVNQRKEAPSSAWNKLGSSYYYFVDNDTFLQR